MLLKIALAVRVALENLHIIGGQEAEQKIEIGLWTGVSEDGLVDVHVVFDERELVARHRIATLAIVG